MSKEIRIFNDSIDREVCFQCGVSAGRKDISGKRGDLQTRILSQLKRKEPPISHPFPPILAPPAAGSYKAAQLSRSERQRAFFKHMARAFVYPTTHSPFPALPSQSSLNFPPPPPLNNSPGLSISTTLPPPWPPQNYTPPPSQSNAQPPRPYSPPATLTRTRTPSPSPKQPPPHVPIRLKVHTPRDLIEQHDFTLAHCGRREAKQLSLAGGEGEGGRILRRAPRARR